MKNLIKIMLAVVLAVFSFPSAGEAKSFTDVPNSHTYYQQVNKMSELGIINGYGDGSFRPNNNISRAHVAVMINRALELKPIREATTFSDVPKSHIYYNEIMALYRAGVVDGVNGKYNPDASLTRGQMAKILTNAFGLQQQQTTKFKDVPLDHHFNPYVGALAANNITTGYGDGTFKPNASLSRVHFTVFLYRTMYQNNPQMNVHFIDVGQGDSIFIQTPNGKSMLIDGGTRAAGSTVVNYLKSKGVSSIDYVVATHPDADHIGGLIDVFAAFQVDHFINSGKEHTTATYEDLLAAVLKEGSTYTEPNTGATFQLDQGISVQVLHANKNATDNNDASLVMKLKYNDVAFMLMGDADQAIETKVASQYDVSAQILKAGHHGSNTSSGLNFMKKVNPQAVILSYGKDNSYGHPHTEVLSAIRTVGASAYATAGTGSVVVSTDGTIFSVNKKAMQTTGGSTGSTPPVVGVIPGAPTSFKNCTEMREYYPNGVPSTHPAYEAKHDRDGDLWACEL
ncbi:MAG: S-layer homology domain-containing protein [Lysinibacillus sp.]